MDSSVELSTSNQEQFKKVYSLHPDIPNQMAFQIDNAQTCPFDGSSDLEMFHIGSDCHYIHCNECQTDGPQRHTEECAVKAWNRIFPRKLRNKESLVEPERREDDEPSN